MTQVGLLQDLRVDATLDAQLQAGYPEQHAQSLRARAARVSREAHMATRTRTLPLMHTFESFVVGAVNLRAGSRVRLLISQPGHLLMLAHCMTAAPAGGDSAWSRRFGLLATGGHNGFVVGIMTPGFDTCPTLSVATRVSRSR